MKQVKWIVLNGTQIAELTMDGTYVVRMKMEVSGKDIEGARARALKVVKLLNEEEHK